MAILSKHDMSVIRIPIKLLSNNKKNRYTTSRLIVELLYRSVVSSFAA